MLGNFRPGHESKGLSLLAEIKVSNQPSNNRRQQRHTSMDISGPYIAAQEQDTKASTVDNIS